MSPITCFAMEDAAFPIRLIQTGRNRFTVIYGQQVDTGLTYAIAARKLGEAIMHSAACLGKLSNEGVS